MKFFQKKPVSEETLLGLLDKLLSKCFDGSKTKLGADATELLELTKYDNSRRNGNVVNPLFGLSELGGGWNEKTANTLRIDCYGKLPVVFI